MLIDVSVGLQLVCLIYLFFIVVSNQVSISRGSSAAPSGELNEQHGTDSDVAPILVPMLETLTHQRAILRQLKDVE